MIARYLVESEIEEGVSLILNDFEPNEPLTMTFASNYPNLQLSLEDRR